MTSQSAAAPRRLKTPGRGPLLFGAAGLALVTAVGIAAPAVALHGWLIGFTVAAGAPLGALALLLAHALTGGRWGEAHRPALLGLARATPALLILVLPLLVGAHATYPWAANPATAGPDIFKFYLNPPAVGLRSVAGLGLLSWLAWRLGRQRPGRLEAGLGLCIYALFMNAAAYDWLLSLAPRFTSSAFGAQIIIGQMLTALCCTVLVSDARRDDPSWGDLGALMLATLLGVAYLVLMGLAINWYGNLPEQADWYMTRTRHGWRWLEGAAALLGATVPLLALLFAGVRNHPVALKPVAVCALIGLILEHVWLVSPATEPPSALVGVVAVPTVAALLGAASRALSMRTEGARHGA